MSHKSNPVSLLPHLVLLFPIRTLVRVLVPRLLFTGN
jgi:hypothetical protein